MAETAPFNITPELQARFWANVDKRGPDECWPWTGGIMVKDGRGVIWTGRKNETAPRMSYMIHHGPIAPGLFACHQCDNPNCVNPAHIWLGRPVDNARDAQSKRRLSGMNKTHCIHGHAYTPENTYWHHLGWRQCRTCIGIRNKARFATNAIESGEWRRK